jgi:hypothetical protein
MKSVYNKNLCFNEQKCIFEKNRTIKSLRKYLHQYFCGLEKIVVFRAAHYELSLVLSEDVLFELNAIVLTVQRFELNSEGYIFMTALALILNKLKFSK